MKSKKLCAVPYCTKKTYARGLCTKHYSRAKHSGLQPLETTSKTCTWKSCRDAYEAHGLCKKHYYYWKMYRDPGLADESTYGNGSTMSVDGYIWRRVAKDHPLAGSNQYVPEHRLVCWEAGLLTDLTMEVHHINENKTDNRLGNLEVLSKKAHARLHGQTNKERRINGRSNPKASRRKRNRDKVHIPSSN